MSDNTQSCLDACNACADACDRCTGACLQEGNASAMARCIQSTIDCAALCRLAASFVARGSAHAKALCELCAAICDDCANECSKHQHQHCQECAAACRRCAEECRRMIGA